MDISRRSALVGIGSTACSICLSQHSQAWPGDTQRTSLDEVAGCRLNVGELQLLPGKAAGFSAISDTTIETTGDAALDKALGKALVRISSALGVRPTFGFFDDSRSPNAYASPDVRVSGTWGAVAFGQTLFRDQLSRYNDAGTSILCIVAHEFGHVIQYSKGLDRQLLQGQPTVKRIELHADIISGWYLGNRKLGDSSVSLWSSGDTFHRIGDYQYNDQQHHGTPDERVSAAELGFKMSYDEKKPLSDAISEATNYVQQY